VGCGAVARALGVAVGEEVDDGALVGVTGTAVVVALGVAPNEDVGDGALVAVATDAVAVAVDAGIVGVAPAPPLSSSEPHPARQATANTQMHSGFARLTDRPPGRSLRVSAANRR
jgi:hypothetical protein